MVFLTPAFTAHFEERGTLASKCERRFFMKVIHFKSRKEQLSREAGKRAFDRFSNYLSYRDLYSLSQLDKAEHTWRKMVDFTGTNAEDWEKEADKYDCETFAQGFFQRSYGVWKGLEEASNE
jgi:hypothetical protein